MVSTRSTNAVGLSRATASASDHAARVFAPLTLPIPNAVSSQASIGSGLQAVPNATSSQASQAFHAAKIPSPASFYSRPSISQFSPLKTILPRSQFLSHSGSADIQYMEESVSQPQADNPSCFQARYSPLRAPQAEARIRPEKQESRT